MEAILYCGSLSFFYGKHTVIVNLSSTEVPNCFTARYFVNGVESISASFNNGISISKITDFMYSAVQFLENHHKNELGMWVKNN